MKYVRETVEVNSNLNLTRVWKVLFITSDNKYLCLNIDTNRSELKTEAQFKVCKEISPEHPIVKKAPHA